MKKKQFVIKKKNGLTIEEAKNLIDELKAHGETEEDIVSVFFTMFQDDKISLEESEEKFL